MNKLEYATYLETAHWQDVRKAMYSLQHHCTMCFIEEENLNVHHKIYENLFKEEYFDLVVLCNKCHRYVHENDIELNTKHTLSDLVRERTFNLMVYYGYDFDISMERAKDEIYAIHGEPKIISSSESIKEYMEDLQLLYKTCQEEHGKPKEKAIRRLKTEIALLKRIK